MYGHEGSKRKNDESEEICRNSTLQRGDLIVSCQNELNETLILSQHNEGASSDCFDEAISSKEATLFT